MVRKMLGEVLKSVFSHMTFNWNKHLKGGLLAKWTAKIIPQLYFKINEIKKEILMCSQA